MYSGLHWSIDFIGLVNGSNAKMRVSSYIKTQLDFQMHLPQRKCWY